jgi:hypothetical protein
MATRSVISLALPNSSFQSIYCHFDGDHLYPILSNQYKTEDQVKDLISLRSLASLEPLDPYNGKNDEAQTQHTINEFKEYIDRCGAEYAYIYIKGKWASLKI